MVAKYDDNEEKKGAKFGRERTGSDIPTATTSPRESCASSTAVSLACAAPMGISSCSPTTSAVFAMYLQERRGGE
jgi:hypothetical protein